MSNPVFSEVVSQHWWRGLNDTAAMGTASVIVDADLGAERSVSVLSRDGAPRLLAVSPDRAHELGVADGDHIEPHRLRATIAVSGITLNDPDHIFHFTIDERERVLAETSWPQSRQLTQDDESLFARFVAEAPGGDLDEAFVELDHWLVYGTVVEGRLVSAASMYPWDGSMIADLGVITLPDVRGRGHARATVRAMSSHAISLGYEPQYRCQFDNTASVALASAAGFTHFADWEVIVDAA